MSFAIHGLPVSQGIAIGYAHLVSRALLEVNHYHVAERHVEDEVRRLDSAVESVRGELAALKNTAASSHAHGEVGAFVDLQLIMLADPLLVDAARRLIQERRCNAEWALVQQMEHLVAQFEQIEDSYLRERKADVVQVVERVVKDLVGHPGHLPPKRRDGLGTIIVAHDLSPADTIGFRDHNIAGFLTDIGGPTSHTAIVARTLAIPAVVGLHRIRDLVEEEELIIIDGTLGIVIVAPDEAIVEEYRLRRSELDDHLVAGALGGVKPRPHVIHHDVVRVDHVGSVRHRLIPRRDGGVAFGAHLALDGTGGALAAEVDGVFGVQRAGHGHHDVAPFALHGAIDGGGVVAIVNSTPPSRDLGGAGEGGAEPPHLVEVLPLGGFEVATDDVPQLRHQLLRRVGRG